MIHATVAPVDIIVITNDVVEVANAISFVTFTVIVTVIVINCAIVETFISVC